MAQTKNKSSASVLTPRLRNTAEILTSTLADRINQASNGMPVFSGRGHGRVTPHGRGPRTTVHRNQKRDMLYFVRDFVKGLKGTEFPKNHDMAYDTTKEFANALVHHTQFFDCDCIAEYLALNWQEIYTAKDVPPHPDVILPADTVGLYFQDYAAAVGFPQFENSSEVMFLCIPVGHGVFDEKYKGRMFNVYILTLFDGISNWSPVGQICNSEDDAVFDHLLSQITFDEETSEACDVGLRLVASALQIINQPRFVIQSKRDVSAVKRQSFKKATGKFIPDAWNIVSWNVDKPVKAKDYEEGTGGRQALHYRRGHWRMAEKGWNNTRWSQERKRWEQYIHGYTAGHAAFGVKKSYHLPRKDIS